MNLPLFITAVFFSIIAGQAYGCSCAAPISDVKLAVGQAYKGASSVVVAQAVSIEKQKVRQAWMDSKDEGIDGEITHFVTVDSWKGRHGENFITKTTMGGGMCGMSFEKGKAYLLYLYGPDKEGYYSASICSRSIKLEGAKEDLAILKTIAPN